MRNRDEIAIFVSNQKCKILSSFLEFFNDFIWDIVLDNHVVQSFQGIWLLTWNPLRLSRRKLIRALSAISQQGRKGPCLRMIKTLCYSIQTLPSKKLPRSKRKLQLLRKTHPSRGPVQLARALENRSVKEKSKINNSKLSKSMCRRPCWRTNLILRSRPDPGSTVIKYDYICWIIWFDWFFTQSEKSAAMPSLLCTTNYTYQK